MKFRTWQVFWKESVCEGRAETTLACPVPAMDRGGIRARSPNTTPRKGGVPAPPLHLGPRFSVSPPMLSSMVPPAKPVRRGTRNQDLSGWKLQAQTQRLLAPCPV